MEKEPGEAEVRSGGTRSTSRIHFRGGDPDAYEPQSGRDPNTLDGLRDIARGAANSARDSVYERFGDVGKRFDDRTGLISAARARPLTALGLAFSAGYLLAHTASEDGGNWLVERARRQLKALIMTSLAAAVVHEIRSNGFDERLGDLLQSLIGREEDDEEFNI